MGGYGNQVHVLSASVSQNRLRRVFPKDYLPDRILGEETSRHTSQVVLYSLASCNSTKIADPSFRLTPNKGFLVDGGQNKGPQLVRTKKMPTLSERVLYCKIRQKLYHISQDSYLTDNATVPEETNNNENLRNLMSLPRQHGDN